MTTNLFEYGQSISKKVPLFTEDAVKAYAACALFADWEEGVPTPTIYDMVRSSWEQSNRDVLQFIKDAEEKGIDVTEYSAEQVGHDIWLSRQGHGTGFFDREEIYGEENAEKLQELARDMGQAYIYPCGNGKWQID